MKRIEVAFLAGAAIALIGLALVVAFRDQLGGIPFTPIVQLIPLSIMFLACCSACFMLWKERKAKIKE